MADNTTSSIITISNSTRQSQTINTYSSIMTPILPASGDCFVNFPKLTGSPTIATPIGTPIDGQIMDHIFTVGTKGGTIPKYTETIYDLDGYITEAMITTIATKANIRFTIRFRYYASLKKFVAIAINAGY